MNYFEKRYEKLNKEQKKAVDAIEGPVLVVAGPGSGKTEILGLRAANILKKTDVLPGNILCLTFTDSAAVNMRDRLRDLIGRDAYKVAIHTFHNFGESIKNFHPEIFYKGAIFSAADELTQLELIGKIFDELDYNNPLKTIHPEQGYIYTKPVVKAIEYLKKAGITPDEFFQIVDYNSKAIEFLNPTINGLFTGRVSKDLFKKIPETLGKIRDYKGENFPVEHMYPLDFVIAESLERALNKSLDEDSPTYLSEWKKENTYKTKSGERALKEAKHSEKMQALAEVYKTYQEKMHSEGYYDFDDMILDVITALEGDDELRYELQEQFLYLMVDEFQDTNDAQMRLINLLTSSEVHEGRPNIMAVGDDDQAIFKFQGAEISNILKFKDMYRNPEIITLVKSYRSRQKILDVARFIITQGEDRLENKLEEVNKKLKAGKSGELGIISNKIFPTRAHEYHWVAEEIRRLLDKGAEPKDIAVISRQHKYLKLLVPYLNNFNIPVSYELQRDVLEEPHIKQIIQIARFVVSMMDASQEDADYLIPEILSYPFWRLKRGEVWELSREAYKKKRPWLECMRKHKNKRIREIADFILNLAEKSQYEPLEKILDEIVGAKMHIVPDLDEEDIGADGNLDREKKGLSSPFKDYYFSYENFENDPATYLTFLSSLRTFVYALREYRQGEALGLKDLVDFVGIHKNNNITLPDNSAFVNSRNAVNLMSVHKAKGLEFETVFVLSCQDDIWASRGRGSRLPFPKNLPITPAGDTKDDQLRLFYVAITRAARQLYLTSYSFDDKGSEVNRVEFLAPPLEENSLAGIMDPEDVSRESLNPETEERIISSSWASYHHPPFSGKEEVLLDSVLKNYKLNATHLNNFLNITDGGPQMFLEQNLLRFPQPKAPQLSYGTAMHNTIHQIYVHLKKKKEIPARQKVLEWFELFLQNERLGKKEFKAYLNRGMDALRVFYSERKESFNESDHSEFNFWNEGVVVENVPLTGKIDKITLKGKKAVVYDFKTGSYVDNWKGKTWYEKIKLWKYKNQLVFYKILVENSRKFGDEYEVDEAFLEFLEPKDDEIVTLPFEIKNEDVERLRAVVLKVYEKIMNLEFPDVSSYSKDIKGIKKFEEDLIN